MVKDSSSDLDVFTKLSRIFETHAFEAGDGGSSSGGSSSGAGGRSFDVDDEDIYELLAEEGLGKAKSVDFARDNSVMMRTSDMTR